MSEEESKNIKEFPDELDLKAIVLSLIDNKNFLFWGTTLFAIIAIIFSLVASEKWSSSALLTPVSTSSAGGSSSVGGLASLAGVSLGKGSKNSSSKAVATITSRDFLRHLMKFDGVLENLMAFESYDASSQKSIFVDALFNADTGKWVDDKKPTAYQAYEVYKGILSTRTSKTSGFVTITIDHGSPVYAKKFLDLIIQEVNNLSRQRDIDETNASLAYLYNELDSVQQSDVQIAVSQLIEEQLKKQMMAHVKTHYTLQPIDSPFVPELRAYPQRTKLVVSWTLLGFFLSLMFVLISEYTRKYFK